jgi:hypothetical protein
MSGPYTVILRPFGMKEFKCNLCGYTTLSLQGMWNHLDHKHPEVNQANVV